MPSNRYLTESVKFSSKFLPKTHSIIHSKEVPKAPGYEKWALRTLVVFTVFGLGASAGIVGWIVYIRIQADMGDQAAINYWDEKLMQDLGLLVVGIILGGVVGVGSLCGYKRLKREVVEKGKVRLLKLVLRGEISEEKAADELGIDKPEMRDVIKELKKEGVIE